MAGILLPACSIFFSLLLLIIFFSKKRVNLVENKVYSIMLIVSFIDSILVTILQAFGFYELNHLNLVFISLINKIDFALLIIFTNCLLLYTLLITIDSVKKNLKKYIIGFGVFDLISLLLIAFSKVEVIEKMNNFTVEGSAVNLVYITVGIYIVSSILVVLFNIKKVDKRHIPVFSIIGIMLFLIIAFKLNPYLIVVSITLTFVDYIMFFTIENPDVKLLSEVRQAKDEAEAANNAKTDFLSSMSHEIRTPLNAIVGFSHSLLDNELTEESISDVKNIIMASDNLLEIVNGILDISKIEANKIEIINNTYNFNNMFDEIVSLAKGRLADKGLTFNYEADEEINEYLFGDELRVKQIIINLLTNAIKYTNEGFIDFKIKKMKQEDKLSLIVIVKDSGIGIKEENLDKLFNKFERMDNVKNSSIEGTGLGLAITKKLLEMMGGSISVSSVYNEGSTFTAVIPQTLPTDEEINKLKEKVTIKEEKIEEELDFSNKNILLVDDNMLNLKVGERLLKNYKVNIKSVTSGKECLDEINNNKNYDLILLDDMMPELSGSETLIKLKEIENFNIPVVVLTANALTGMREDYLSKGFDDYLSKPLDKEELKRVLIKYLKKE